MTQRAQLLYDCITQVSDQYLEEAEGFVPAGDSVVSIPWKRWGSLAAALVVAAGIGLAVMPRMGGGSANSSAPAASIPAAEAPSAAPESSFNKPDSAVGGESAGTDQISLAVGMEVRLEDGVTLVLTGVTEGKTDDHPSDGSLRDEVVIWLTVREDTLVPSQEPTGITLHYLEDGSYLVRDGEESWTAQLS